MVADDLRRQADAFLDLDSLRSYITRSQKAPQKDVSNQIASVFEASAEAE
jgi:uncharacterized LabA/DUF88 family protein